MRPKRWCAVRAAGADIIWHAEGPAMLIIGHRGAAALAPENTLAALMKGLACADAVEVDVRLSEDGVPVVIHDATLERTTNGQGPVRSRSLEELRSLDAGDGERIPTLAEVLALVKGRTLLIVELKMPDTAEPALDAVRASGHRNVLVVSFHPEALDRSRAAQDTVKTGLIVRDVGEDTVERAISLGAAVLLPRFDSVSHDLIAAAHRAGLSVFVWTLAGDEEYRRAAAIGADGVATNDPCAARRFFIDLEDRWSYCGPGR
jgi:glycerophosphoryl diester phosphodiesterase